MMQVEEMLTSVNTQIVLAALGLANLAFPLCSSVTSVVNAFDFVSVLIERFCAISAAKRF